MKDPAVFHAVKHRRNFNRFRRYGGRRREENVEALARTFSVHYNENVMKFNPSDFVHTEAKNMLIDITLKITAALSKEMQGNQEQSLLGQLGKHFADVTGLPCRVIAEVEA